MGVLALTAGELALACSLLFREQLVYAGAALLRQVVECEELARAFLEQDGLGRAWSRSTHADRQRQWAPATVRKRVPTTWAQRDYSLHCDMGGHPSPDSGRLLHRDASAESGRLLAYDACFHLSRTWQLLHEAVLRDCPQLVERVTDAAAVAQEAIVVWQATDPMHEWVAKTMDAIRPPTGK